MNQSPPETTQTLSPYQSSILTPESLYQRLVTLINGENLAIRCNLGKEIDLSKPNSAFSLCAATYSREEFSTRLFASIGKMKEHLSQKNNPDDYLVLLIRGAQPYGDHGETYTYKDISGNTYQTLPKCHGLGEGVHIVKSFKLSHGTVTELANRIMHFLNYKYYYRHSMHLPENQNPFS